MYAMRDGLSQISWLCKVLEDFAKLHKKYVEEGDDGDEEHKFLAHQKWIQNKFVKQYKGSHVDLDVVFRCFEQLSDDVRTTANEIRVDPPWVSADDEWGIKFLELLDTFQQKLNDAITTFLTSSIGHLDMYATLNRFTATHEDIQEKLVDLLHFTYDCDTKMGSSANKQRIQRNYEWTRLCTYCVWITTTFTDEELGPVDKLYADSMSRKEELEQQLNAYVFDCALDAQETIHNRRDAQIHAPAGPAVKRTPKKARPHAVHPEQRTQMTELLGELRACMQ